MTHDDSLGMRPSASPIQKYLDVQVGADGFGALVKYESLASIGAWLPGALGFAYRRLLWPRLFGRSGRKIVWGHGVVVRHPGKMFIGERVMIDDGCYLNAGGCDVGDFRIGDDVLVNRGSIVASKGGKLDIGPRVNVGPYCQLWCRAGLSIGDDTMLAGNCYLGGGAYDPDGRVDIPMSAQTKVPGPVVVGRDCWLGASVVVVGGVTIGEGCVIGAGSVVTHDVPSYSVAVGSPARVMRQRQNAPPPSPEDTPADPDRGPA